MSTVRFDLDRHVCHNLVAAGAVTEADALVFWTLAYSAATGRDPDPGRVRLREPRAHVRNRSALATSASRATPPTAWPRRPLTQDGCGGMALP